MSHVDSRISVRPAQASDAALCLWFERQDEYGRTTAIDERAIQAQILLGAAFIAESEDRAVGYASLNFLYASKTPLLSWWFVEASHRGLGVGGLLLAAVESSLASQGFERLLISACREKEIARHRAAGLEEIGVIRLGPAEVEHFFAKALKPASL